MAGVAIATAAVMTSTPPTATKVREIQRLHAEEKRRNRLTEAGREPAVQMQFREQQLFPTPESTSPMTLAGVAPSAMRTPSSRVRCCTEYASTPNTPTMASSKRQRPERPDQQGAKSISLGGGAGHALERRDVVRGLTWIHFRDGRAHGRGERCRVAVRHADDEV